MSLKVASQGPFYLQPEPYVNKNHLIGNNSEEEDSGPTKYDPVSLTYLTHPGESAVDLLLLTSHSRLDVTLILTEVTPVWWDSQEEEEEGEKEDEEEGYLDDYTSSYDFFSKIAIENNTKVNLKIMNGERRMNELYIHPSHDPLSPFPSSFKVLSVYATICLTGIHPSPSRDAPWCVKVQQGDDPTSSDHSAQSFILQGPFGLLALNTQEWLEEMARYVDEGKMPSSGPTCERHFLVTPEEERAGEYVVSIGLLPFTRELGDSVFGVGGLALTSTGNLLTLPPSMLGRGHHEGHALSSIHRYADATEWEEAESKRRVSLPMPKYEPLKLPLILSSSVPKVSLPPLDVQVVEGMREIELEGLTQVAQAIQEVRDYMTRLNKAIHTLTLR